METTDTATTAAPGSLHGPETCNRPAAPVDPAADAPTTSPALTPVSWAGAKPAVGAALAVREHPGA
ncbi:hypothetical protein DEO23_10480 [Brachybacterium endophyticum]|uniref:Uncharacterized protein n=1 Tax=Brachybacterium endophyticum TaxID=2182385 RepID=A0A2U2RK50_9MICO|nr:hypothetical protein [Brachybacterium endophyticum]PWH06211.1 hypothetical protein DEO23_10480 [Brachybacterium endophyticum]